MTEPTLEARLAAELKALERIWPWGRKELVAHVQQQLQQADAQALQMQAQHQAVQAELSQVQAQLSQANALLPQWQSACHKVATAHRQLRSQYQSQQETHRKLETVYTSLSQFHKSRMTELKQLQCDYDALNENHTAQEARFQTLANEHQSLAEVVDGLRETLKKQEQDMKRKRADIETLQKLHDTLKNEHATLYEEHRHLSREATLIRSRYDLVRNILNSEPADNPALRELQHWLEQDFVQDIQRLELPADVTTPALEQGKAIGLHAELLADSPALRTKFLAAVAGGFSSGKSSFVTSFMRREDSQLLAKGIQPVTAIPTYVMPSEGEKLSIQGHTHKGAHIELSKEAYSQLTHDFISGMGFNVKAIMPHVVIESPMPTLSHLAFIDMPGYDPAASDTADTAADRGVASAALTEADAVIWLVALDSNGTLPANDLEFLSDHADERPLYVVLNKADLRPLENVEMVLEEIQEHLEDCGIAYEGISAYSSTLGKELLHCGKSLQEIMQEWDRQSSAAISLHKEFDALLDGLEKSTRKQHKKSEKALDLLHSLELDLMQIAGSENEVFRNARDRLAELKEELDGVEWGDARQILENMRSRGHALLSQSFGTEFSPRSNLDVELENTLSDILERAQKLMNF